MRSGQGDGNAQGSREAGGIAGEYELASVQMMRSMFVCTGFLTETNRFGLALMTKCAQPGGTFTQSS